MRIYHLSKNPHLDNYLFVDGPDFYNSKRINLGALNDELVVDEVFKKINLKRKSLIKLHNEIPKNVKNSLEERLKNTKVSLELS